MRAPDAQSGPARAASLQMDRSKQEEQGTLLSALASTL